MDLKEWTKTTEPPNEKTPIILYFEENGVQYSVAHNGILIDNIYYYKSINDKYRIPLISPLYWIYDFNTIFDELVIEEINDENIPIPF